MICLEKCVSPLEEPTGIAPFMRSCRNLCPILSIHVTNSVPHYSPLSAFRHKLSVLRTRIFFSLIPDTTQSLETNSVFYSDLNCYVVCLLQAPPSGSACFILTPHSWSFEVTHNDAPQSVGLPWTRGQLVTETSTWQHTQPSQQTNIHASGGIRTHDPSRRTAVDVRLRPRCHWDRLTTRIRC